MAKSDSSHRCLCGLHKECHEHCLHYSRPTNSVGPWLPSNLYAADRLASLAEDPQEARFREMFAEPKE